MVSEWIDTKLGDVLTLKRGYDLPAQDRQPGPFPVVSSSGVTGSHIAAKANGPGVVTGRYGTLGKTHFITEDYWPLNTTLYVKDFKGNDPRFISYFLKGLNFASYNDKSSVPGLNRNHLHSEIVHFPADLAEQREISGTLGTLDDKIELNRQMNRTLEAMARAIFKAWFVDFEPVKAKAAGATSFRSMPQAIFEQIPDRFADTELGPVPKGWEVAPLSNLVELIGGGTPKRGASEYWDGDIPWFSVKDAPNEADVWVINTGEKITTAGLEHSSAKVMRAGTSIISARGTVGRLALAAIPMSMNQSCYGVEGKEGIGDYFVYFTLHNAVVELQKRTHGSVFDTITRRTFDGLERVMPQPEVLAAFEEVVSPYMMKMRGNLFESKLLADIRDILLPKLISGDLRVPRAKGEGNEK